MATEREIELSVLTAAVVALPYNTDSSSPNFGESTGPVPVGSTPGMTIKVGTWDYHCRLDLATLLVFWLRQPVDLDPRVQLLMQLLSVNGDQISLTEAFDWLSGRQNYLASAALYPGMQNENLRQAVLRLQSDLGLMRVQQQSDRETMAVFQQSLSNLGELQAAYEVKRQQNEAAITALYAQGELQAADIEELQARDELHSAALVLNTAVDARQDAELVQSRAADVAEQARLTVLESQQAIQANNRALDLAHDQQDDATVAALQAQLGQLQTKLTADEQQLATLRTQLDAATASTAAAQQAANTAQQKADATAAALVIAQAATTAAQTTANNALATSAALSARIREVLGVITPGVTLTVTGTGSTFDVVVDWSAQGAFVNNSYGVFFSNVGSNLLKNLTWSVLTKALTTCTMRATNALGLALTLSPSSMDFLIYHTP